MLDGYQALPRFERTCCEKCIHFHGKQKGTCDAYPKGIPDKYSVRNVLAWMAVHTTIEKDQTGKFTFQTE